MNLDYTEIQKIKTYLENLENELIKIKDIISTIEKPELSKTDAQIREIKEQLSKKNVSKKIIDMIGIIPISDNDYKKDIRLAILKRNY